MHYDGTQLHSLYAYLQHGILGDSGIAWQGSCDVSFEHMVDGEDLLDQSEIRGSEMVHFIFEIFDQSLMTGVLLQRLFATIARDVILDISPVKGLALERSGDDLYWKKGKLSISIATRSPVSTMVHFAVNVKNQGTPVATACLQDFKVDAKKFAQLCLEKVSREYDSSLIATRKVKPVS